MDILLYSVGGKKVVWQCLELVFLAFLVIYNWFCNLCLTLMLCHLARLGVLFHICFVRVVYV